MPLTIQSNMDFLIENKFFGNKSRKGFYYRTKDENGKRQIMALNLETLEYEPSQRVKIGSVETAKTF